MRRCARLGNRCGPAVAGFADRVRREPQPALWHAARALHDPSVIAYLLRPELYDGREVNVAIETQSPLTIGMTVVDWWGVTGRPPNVRFLNTVDAEGFYDLLTDKLARLP